MKYPFNDHLTTGLRRLLCIITVIALMTSLMAGCGKKKEEDEESDEPKTSEDSLLELDDPTSEPTQDTTDDTTSDDPTEETIDPELLKIRNAPSMDGTVLGHLQPGSQVTVLREEVVGDERWALIREGWICIQRIEEYTGPNGIIIDDGTGGSTRPNQTEPAGNDGNNNNNNNNNNTGNAGNGGNNNNAGTGTTAKITGFVTASELNIRKDAGTNYDSVGQYKKGDKVSIVETKNGWGRTDKGWISLDYVYQTGKTGKNPAKGIVTGNGLNIRSGPGTNYDAVGSYDEGARVNILEQIQIGDTKWGCTEKGWISLGYVYIDGTKGEHSGTGTVIGNDVNVRSGPGTNFDPVGAMNYGNDVEIFHQVKVNDTWWGCIGSGKWICMDYVGMG